VVKEMHTIATASHGNNRVVLARFPAPPLGIVKAGMRRNLVAGAIPSQSDLAKHWDVRKLHVVGLDNNRQL